MGRFWKRIGIFMAVLAFVLGCGRRNSVISLEEAGTLTEEQIVEKLKGFGAKEIEAAWGEPVWQLFGLYGDIYAIDEERTLVVTYSNDGKTVEAVSFNFVSHEFEGVIKEKGEKSAVVEVDKGYDIRRSGDQVSVSLEGSSEDFQVGDRVKVTYQGGVMESYPLQLENQISIEIVGTEAAETTDADTEAAVTETANTETARLTSPPALMLQDVLSSAYSPFSMNAGTYSWNYKTENTDEITAVEACGSAPLDAVQGRDTLKVPKYNKQDSTGYLASWSIQPDQLTVTEYMASDIGNMDAAPVSETRYDEKTEFGETAFLVQLKPERVYVIKAQWNEEKLDERGYCGSGEYVVMTE